MVTVYGNDSNQSLWSCRVFHKSRVCPLLFYRLHSDNGMEMMMLFVECFLVLKKQMDIFIALYTIPVLFYKIHTFFIAKKHSSVVPFACIDTFVPNMKLIIWRANIFC